MRRTERGRRVLVVDDNESLAEVIGEALTAEGYAVSLAFDADRALALFREVEPALVLLDMHLPPWRGPDVLAALSFHQRRPCSFIAMTGDPDVPEHAAAILFKPFGLDELLEVVRAHCPPSDQAENLPAPGL